MLARERRRCLRGHLILPRYVTYCVTCWRMNRYYKARIELGMSNWDASVYANMATNTEHYRKVRRAGRRRCDRRYRDRWGQVNTSGYGPNPVHWERKNNIHNGIWKEEEHPL